MEAKLKYDGIIFIGHMAAGKTYTLGRVAELLKKKYDIDLNKLSIASGVKEIAVKYFGMKEKDRRLLQQIGTKMREIDPEVWIKSLVMKIGNENLVPFGIDDVRFLNEIDKLKEKHSIFIVKLQPDENQRLEEYKNLYGRYPTYEELNDSTEKEIDKLPYDYLLKNNYNQRYITPNIEEIVNIIVNTS